MLKNMKIGSRLAIGFCTTLILLIIVTAISMNRIKQINGDIRSLVQQDFPKTVIANSMINAVSVNGRILRNAYIFKDAEVQKELDRLPEQSRILSEGLAKLDQMITTDAGKAALQKVKDVRAAYVQDMGQYINLIKTNQHEEAASLLSGALRTSQSNYIASVELLVQGQTALIQERGKGAAKLASDSEQLLLILAVAAIALSAGLGWLITRSITEPTRQLMEHANHMASGGFSNQLVLNQKDEIGSLAQSLGAMQAAVQAMISDADMLSKAAVEGKLATRADASKHQGDFRKIVQGVNDTLDAVIGPLNVAADYVAKISVGNIPPMITDSYNGDFNILKNNFYVCIAAVNALVADANLLSKAAVEGKLATRADASKHQGDFRKVVAGVNDTLDAVIGPLNVAAEYVAKISIGDIPAKITDSYNGDFNIIKNNLNTCISAVNALVADAVLLSQAAVDGKLATRADASKHQGDFRKVVAGVNDTLDAVIGPLNVAAEYVAKISIGDMPPVITAAYNGDFNTIKNNLNVCIEATNQQAAAAKGISMGDLTAVVKIRSENDVMAKALIDVVKAVNELVADANRLSKAAVDGNLELRADATHHQGDFRRVVEGLNDVMIAVNTPVSELRDVLGAIEGGDLTLHMTRQYAGTWDDLKSALNNMLAKLAEVVTDVNGGAQALAGASEEVSATAQSLSQAASEQAAGVEETSASIEQMTSSIAQNTENAKITDGMASKAARDAVDGGEAVQATVTAMKQKRTAEFPALAPLGRFSELR